MAIQLKSWSERQQVLAIIGMAGLVLCLLWFFLLLPLNRKRQSLEAEISGMQTQLASKNYLIGEDVLQSKRNQEATHNRAMHTEWTNMVARMQSFREAGNTLTNAVGHIDYKVALFEVRQRLLKKSRDMSIRLRDTDLGLDDVVRGDEDARRLMLQLRTVEKLVDFTFDLKINMLRAITPLPPIQHVFRPEKPPFMEEYPVKVEFYGQLNSIYALFEAAKQPETPFALRRLRVEVEPAQPDLLKVSAVMSALLFLRDPDVLIEDIPKKKVERLEPLGH